MGEGGLRGTLAAASWGYRRYDVFGLGGNGNALYFDGSTPARSWVNCGTWNPSAETGQLTIALWVRWDGPIAGMGQMIMAKRDYWDQKGTGQMWGIRIDENRNII